LIRKPDVVAAAVVVVDDEIDSVDSFNRKKKLFFSNY